MKKVLALTLVLLGLLSCKTKQTKGIYNDQTVDGVDTITLNRADADTFSDIQTGLFRLNHIPVDFKTSKKFRETFNHGILVTRLYEFKIFVYDIRGFKKRKDVFRQTHKRDSLVWATTDREILGWAGRRPFSEVEFWITFEELFNSYLAGNDVFLENQLSNIFYVKTAKGEVVAVDLWLQNSEWCIHARRLNSVWLYGGRAFLRRKFDK